ncbi:MAG TPA: DUF1223 domain-containing protein [Methylocella sp.]|nr:DUF1223 domain-containing protein [Methylocella sp.]
MNVAHWSWRASAGAALIASALGGAGAQEPALRKITHVIELFTSQGCSYCPRADQLVQAIAHEPGIAAVSYPVDYWDYIGWHDTLASPGNTQRQKSYAAGKEGGQVFTPQIIVDGSVSVAGGDHHALHEAMAGAGLPSNDADAAITLRHEGSHFFADIAGGQGGPATVLALRITPSSTVRIQRGENAGRTVTYTNVVREINDLGVWTGGAISFELPSTANLDDGFIVLLQKGTPEQPGAILAAAKTAGL